jgi:cytochrome d ubiquinol oxidase subunit I
MGADPLLARAQMGVSLAFHIVFAAIGVAMPVLMVAAEILARRRRDDEYRQLARTWARGTAVFFAVGAVSGTVLSFELGLLFPGFMRLAGPLVGIPFSLEGFAFFTEAIFLGIYLYGWERVRPGLHIFAGVVVAASGLLSAVFVTLVNAWMNAPSGFRVDATGALVDIDPLAAMATPFALHESVHMALAAYMATALGAAGVHAYGLWRDRASTFHRKALGLCLALAVPASLAQPLVGHMAGQEVARHQPLKLAAMEQLEHTQRHAPVTMLGVQVPGGLSFLVANDFDAEVTGLDAFPAADWPHPVVRVGWQLMVLIGTGLGGYAAWAVWRRLRRRDPADSRLFLGATIGAGPLAFLALEAGWVVTEVGRQPWTVYGVLRTNSAATPFPALIVPFVVSLAIYALLAAVVALTIRRHVHDTVTV